LNQSFATANLLYSKNSKSLVLETFLSKTKNKQFYYCHSALQNAPLPITEGVQVNTIY